MPTSSTLQADQLSWFCFPEFSNSALEEIRTKTVRASTRTEVIESIGRQMWNHTKTPSSEEYTTVCRILVSKFPVLEDTTGNGIVSWFSAKLQVLFLSFA